MSPHLAGIGNRKTAAWRQLGYNDGIVPGRKPRLPLSEPQAHRDAYMSGFRGARRLLEEQTRA